MNPQVIRYHFRIRIAGGLSALILIGLSDYKQHIFWLIGTVILYITNALLARNRLLFYKSSVFHEYNLFIDILFLSIAIAIRGGLRSDFYLGYYLVLGYVLFVRSRYLMLKLSIFIVVCYSLFAFLVRDDTFSYGRLIIRLCMLIGTSLLLQKYAQLLSDTESLREKATQMAMFDRLTGVYNRRILDHIESIYSDEAAGLFAVMLDLDNFKFINDAYGHPRGDEILVTVAEEIEKAIENESMCIRYGGEEFLILLRTELDEDVVSCLRSVQKALKHKDFTWMNSSDTVTFTAGAAKREPHESISQTIERADNALYKGKFSGKNCIVMNNQVAENTSV